MVKFYEGGLSFEYAYKISLYSLNMLRIEASKINANIEQNMKRK